MRGSSCPASTVPVNSRTDRRPALSRMSKKSVLPTHNIDTYQCKPGGLKVHLTTCTAPASSQPESNT